MNQPTSGGSNEESKIAAIKTLAIVGFIVAIVFFVWLAVQVVRVAPTAFGTLASLAESVYGTQKPFDARVNKNVVNSGDTMTLSWDTVRTSGTYDVLYQCVEGVSLEARDVKGNIVAPICGVPFLLDAEKESADLLFTSEKDHFADITLAVRFTPTNTPEKVEEKTFLLTVVNAALAEETPVVEEPEPEEETPVTEPEPEETPVVTPPKPTQPVVTPAVPVPTHPVSNPNGFTDLQVTYLGIGTYDESTRVFTPTTQIDNDKRGAFRFEVKNTGTKTSDTWTYTVTFPDESTRTYTSPLQMPLQPGERDTVLIAFSDIAEKAGTYDISVKVATARDTVSHNNGFEWSIKIVD